MLILGTSTTSDICSVALWRDGEVVALESFPGARRCVEELVPTYDRLLTAAGAAVADLDMLALDIGPGGMTGLKIGVVTVRTIAQAAGKPVAGVTSPIALAYDMPDDCDTAVVIIKCTSREVYTSIVERSADGFVITGAERVDSIADAPRRIAGSDAERVYVTGDRAAEAVVPGMRGVVLAGEAQRVPSAVNVCRAAAGMTPVDYSQISPNYVCLTNAERTKIAGSK